MRDFGDKYNIFMRELTISSPHRSSIAFRYFFACCSLQVGYRFATGSFGLPSESDLKRRRNESATTHKRKVVR